MATIPVKEGEMADCLVSSNNGAPKRGGKTSSVANEGGQATTGQQAGPTTDDANVFRRKKKGVKASIKTDTLAARPEGSEKKKSKTKPGKESSMPRRSSKKNSRSRKIKPAPTATSGTTLSRVSNNLASPMSRHSANTVKRDNRKSPKKSSALKYNKSKKNRNRAASQESSAKDNKPKPAALLLQESDKDEKGALDYSFTTITSEPCQASLFAHDISTPAGHPTTQSPKESNSCFGKWWNSLLGSEKSANNENVDTVVDDYDVPLCTWCAWINTKDTLKGGDEEEDLDSDDNLSLSNFYSESLISVESSSTMSYDGTQTTTTPTGRTYSTSSSFDVEDDETASSMESASVGWRAPHPGSAPGIMEMSKVHIATFQRNSLNICDDTRSADVSALPPSHSGEQESAFEDANRDDEETMPLHIDSVDSERDDTDQLSVATDDLMFRMEELLQIEI